MTLSNNAVSHAAFTFALAPLSFFFTTQVKPSVSGLKKGVAFGSLHRDRTVPHFATVSMDHTCSADCNLVVVKVLSRIYGSTCIEEEKTSSCDEKIVKSKIFGYPFARQNIDVGNHFREFSISRTSS